MSKHFPNALNGAFKPLVPRGATLRGTNLKYKSRFKPNQIPQTVDEKQFSNIFTQTEEDCDSDVIKLTKAAHVIYSICHKNEGNQILHTENVLEECSNILQAFSHLNKSFEFQEIPESILFTGKFKEGVKSIETCQKRCRELISSEELRTFLSKSELTNGNLLVPCICLLEEFLHRERTFRQAVLSIVGSEKLGKTKAEEILSQTDHKEQINTLVESVVETQRDIADEDKNELHKQNKEKSIKQQNDIQKLQMKVKELEEEKTKIKEKLRKKDYENHQEVIKCKETWEKQKQDLLEKQEKLRSEKMKTEKKLEEEKQMVAQKQITIDKLNNLYNDAKKNLEESKKLNYNMSKARGKKTEDKGCQENLQPSSKTAFCQTDSRSSKHFYHMAPPSSMPGISRNNTDTSNCGSDFSFANQSTTSSKELGSRECSDLSSFSNSLHK